MTVDVVVDPFPFAAVDNHPSNRPRLLLLHTRHRRRCHLALLLRVVSLSMLFLLLMLPWLLLLLLVLLICLMVAVVAVLAVWQ